jgi:lipoprotein-releasing system ATP-binding protein
MHDRDTKNAILYCTELHKDYQDEGHFVSVLKGVDFAVYPGERVAIMGRSGSGKSTLLNLLGGLEAPNKGDVFLNGACLSSQTAAVRGELRNRYLGFIFQFHHLLMEFNAVENVAMPLFIRGMGRLDAIAVAENLLAQVGLAHRSKHRPAQLSGGERQRVAIARALLTKPSCLLADEPTGNLDDENAQQIMALILELSRSHQTSCVMVTHDQALAKQMDRVILLEQGRVVSCLV